MPGPPQPAERVLPWGGEDDATVPDAPSEFTIDPLGDEDIEHRYESPAFLRRAT